MDSVRFDRTARLTNGSAFRYVFQKPIRSSDACLTILSRTNNQDHARLGLALARKHVHRAVARNRLKRLIREYFRLHCAQLPNVDLVVLAKPGVGRRSNDELRASLGRHWKRLSNSCGRC